MDDTSDKMCQWVEIAGIDPHGNLRGKIISQQKLESAKNFGLGFSCGPLVSDSRDGFVDRVDQDFLFPDLLFRLDDSPGRRMPWKENRIFLLVNTSFNRVVSKF